MELEDEDKIDSFSTVAPMRPDYPPGLRISLTEKEFEKLDLDHSVAEIGGIVHAHFLGRITSVSHNHSTGGEPCCRVEIQIEDLEIESEDDENEEEE